MSIDTLVDSLPDTISLEDKEAAKACLKESRKTDIGTWKYNLSAPLVMLFVLPFVKREANKLPEFFSKWDNNISLNGDAGGVYIPKDHPEFGKYPGVSDEKGIWVDFLDIPNEDGAWQPLVDCLQVKYDDPVYGGYCYYAKGHHPRSFWARYMWVGWRNRASQLSIEVGEEITEPIVLLAGDETINTAKEGFFLLKSGSVYQLKTFTKSKLKLFGKQFCTIRSLGYKLEIVKGAPQEGNRAATVYIPWSMKGWKGA